MLNTDDSKDLIVDRTCCDYFDEGGKEFAELYVTKPSFVERYQIFEKNISWILSEMDLTDFLSMDIGCGNGILSRIVAKRGGQVIGIDQSTNMIKLAKEEADRENVSNLTNYVVATFPGDLRNFYGKCNLIIASSVLEYIEDLEGALIEINRLLRANGFLIASMPNYWSFYRFLQRNLRTLFLARDSYLRYQKWQIRFSRFRSIATKCGLEYVRHEYFGVNNRIHKLVPNYRNSLIGNLFLMVLRKDKR